MGLGLGWGDPAWLDVTGPSADRARLCSALLALLCSALPFPGAAGAAARALPPSLPAPAESGPLELTQHSQSSCPAWSTGSRARQGCAGRRSPGWGCREGDLYFPGVTGPPTAPHPLHPLTPLDPHLPHLICPSPSSPTAPIRSI